MFFSVLIPVYNAENYLRECLDSVQKQTFDDFEVILADDGSTDKSGNICDEYAKNDMRFKVLHLENGGAVRARKNALHASSGDYIVFADSDDLLDTGLLERLREAVLREAPDMVAFGYQLFDAGGVLLKNKNAPRAGAYEGERLKKVQKALIYDKRQRSFNYGSVIYSLWSKAWRAEFLREHEALLPENLTKGEDMALTVSAVCAAKKICFLDEYGYFYRVTPGSMMNSFQENEPENLLNVYRTVRKNAPELPENNIAVWLLYMCLEYAAQASEVYSDESAFAAGLEKNLVPLSVLFKKARLYLPRLNDILPVYYIKAGKYKKLYALLKKRAGTGKRGKT